MLESARRVLARAAAFVAGVGLIGCATPGRAVVAQQYRIARPTERLDELVRFYRDGLGLPVLGSFEGHAGYDGQLIGTGLPGHELELTQQVGAPHHPPPSDDHLLVLYYPDRAALEAVAERLRARGHAPVAPANPYWNGRSLTFADPDGWRVVLFDAATLGRPPT